MAYDTNKKQLLKIETIDEDDVYEEYDNVDNDVDFNLLNDILFYQQFYEIFSKIKKHRYIIYLFGLLALRQNMNYKYHQSIFLN